VYELGVEVLDVLGEVLQEQTPLVGGEREVHGDLRELERERARSARARHAGMDPAGSSNPRARGRTLAQWRSGSPLRAARRSHKEES
jgi:hypothetical protein